MIVLGIVLTIMAVGVALGVIILQWLEDDDDYDI